ncbi:MAG TPA: cytochrome P450 [Rugosimonospora sp.]|nr:cytochrome P450 [Rugosimonospora sp.]
MSTLTDPVVTPTVPVSTEHGLRLVRALRHDPLPLLYRVNHDHGPLVRLRMPRLQVYLVSDPDAIQEAFLRTHHGYDKGWGRRADPDSPSVQPLARALGQGLLTSGADLHRRQRRLIQPLFHRERIDAYANSFVSLTREASARWRDGDLRDVLHEMGELTLAIVARTVFDVELGTEVVDTIRHSLAENQATVRRSATLWGQVLDRLPVPSTRRWNASAREVDAMLYRLIAARRADGVPGTDLLSLLLSARDADTGEPMPDRQVRDEALTLLLAGHETTANALAWALYLLAEHPAEQARARAELAALDGPPTATDLPRLRYVAAIVNESMRLYPPAWIILRHLTEARTIGGYPLPAGATLLMSPWVVHRDATWWPQPHRFHPQRWLEPGVPPHRYAYFPFGGGPRQCIGNDFALTEATLVLATLLRDWQVVAPAGTPPVRPLPLITLRPRNGVWLTVRRAL